MLTLVLHNWLPKESLHSESHRVPRQEVQLFSASGLSPAFFRAEQGDEGSEGKRTPRWALSFLISTQSSARVGTGLSAGLEAEAFVTGLALGFGEVHGDMGERTVPAW